MSKDDLYTVNIGNLKVSGSAEEIHRLATIYSLASCEYGHEIVEEIHGKHRNKLIKELEDEQKHLDNIYKQIIDSIRNSEYYKRYSSMISDMIDGILKDLEGK